MNIKASIGRTYVAVELPIRTVSEANQGGKLRDKFRRKREQKMVTEALLWAYRPLMKLPSTVRLTRISPRELDDDNLRSAFKVIRDSVAKLFGVDDRDPRVTWAYAQERRRDYAVRVEITHTEETRS